MSSANLVLPFAVVSAETGKSFSPEMEVAAALLWAEEKRKQKRFLDVSEKRLLSISKLYYPLWAVPWANASLIVDGLDVLSSTIAFQTLPDVIAFIDDIERGTSVREQFLTALAKHEGTFGELAKIEQIQVNGLVSDDELSSALHDYIKEATSLKQVGNNLPLLLPPKLDRKAALQRASRISQLQKRIFSEIKSLEYASGLLGEIAKSHEEMILKETDQIREAYNAQINEMQPSVDEKTDHLLRELDASTLKINRRVDNELEQREKERQRLERKLERLELSKADSQKRREIRRQKHDGAGAAHWERRIKLEDSKIEEIKTRMRTLSAFIDKTRTQNQEDIEKLRQGYQWRIDQEKRKIIDLELKRDSIVASRQEEIDKIRNLTGLISGGMEELIQRKWDQETRLKKLVMAWPLDETTLICIPFYLAHYTVEAMSEFKVLSPSIVTRGQGLVRTLQKTLKSLGPVSRSALPLQPRSKALGRMLDSVIVSKMESDESFRDSLHEVVKSGNIVAKPNFNDTLSKGVKELKAERWISQKEVDLLTQTFI